MPECRGLKELIKEAKDEVSQQGAVAFSPRTTSLTVLRPRGQKPADERFFEKLEEEVRRPQNPPPLILICMARAHGVVPPHVPAVHSLDICNALA